MSLFAILPGLPFSGHKPPPFKQGFFDADLGQTMYFDYEDVVTIVPSTSRPGFLDVIDIDEDTGRRVVFTIAPQPVPSIFHLPPLTAGTRAVYRLFVKGTKLAPIAPKPVRTPPPKKAPEGPIKLNPGIAPGVGTGKKGSLDDRERRDLLDLGARLPGGGIGGGPGASSWLRGLLGGRRGGRVVSSTSGPHGSTSGGTGDGGGSGNNNNAGDFSYEGADKPSGAGDGAGLADLAGVNAPISGGGPTTPSGNSGGEQGSQENERRQKSGRYYTVTHYDENGNPVSTEERSETADPTRDPSGLTGNRLVDMAIMRQTLFEAGFISAPQGPSRALRPDVDGGAGSPSQADIEAVIALDPLAPLVNPTGTDYESRRHYPPRVANRAGRSPYIEALYPDGDPRDDQGPIVAEPHQPPPGEGGDPHALVKSFTTGIGAASVNMLASGISARRRRAH